MIQIESMIQTQMIQFNRRTELPVTEIRKILGGAVQGESQEFGFKDFKFETENHSLDLVIWRIG